MHGETIKVIHILNVWGGKVSIMGGGDSIGHCEKKNYMNMCPIMITKIEMFESNTQYCSLPLLSIPIFRRFFYGFEESELYKRNVNSRNKLLACILDAAARKNGHTDRLRQHSSFAQEIQSSLRLTMGFSKIYGQHVYHLFVTNSSF